MPYRASLSRDLPKAWPFTHSEDISRPGPGQFFTDAPSPPRSALGELISETVPRERGAHRWIFGRAASMPGCQMRSAMSPAMEPGVQTPRKPSRPVKGRMRDTSWAIWSRRERTVGFAARFASPAYCSAQADLSIARRAAAAPTIDFYDLHCLGRRLVCRERTVSGCDPTSGLHDRTRVPIPVGPQHRISRNAAPISGSGKLCGESTFAFDMRVDRMAEHRASPSRSAENSLCRTL